MFVLARFFRILIGIGLTGLAVFLLLKADKVFILPAIFGLLFGLALLLGAFKKKSEAEKARESGATLGAIFGFLLPIPMVMIPCVMGPVCGEAPLGLIFLCPVGAIVGGMLGQFYKK